MVLGLLVGDVEGLDEGLTVVGDELGDVVGLSVLGLATVGLTVLTVGLELVLG